MQNAYGYAQENKPYLVVSLSTPSKILFCGTKLKDQNYLLWLYLNYAIIDV